MLSVLSAKLEKEQNKHIKSSEEIKILWNIFMVMTKLDYRSMNNNHKKELTRPLLSNFLSALYGFVYSNPAQVLGSYSLNPRVK
ncbi:hypothetical protein N8865_00425 [Francisellaceae bacterium]|nr:hypothetical protein [Francisellaceae bacterium]